MVSSPAVSAVGRAWARSAPIMGFFRITSSTTRCHPVPRSPEDAPSTGDGTKAPTARAGGDAPGTGDDGEANGDDGAGEGAGGRRVSPGDRAGGGGVTKLSGTGPTGAGEATAC